MGVSLADYDKLIVFRNFLAFLDIIFVVLFLMKLGNGETFSSVASTGLLAGFFFIAFIVVFIIEKFRRRKSSAEDERPNGCESEEATAPPPPFSSVVTSDTSPPSPALPSAPQFVSVEPSAPSPDPAHPLDGPRRRPDLRSAGRGGGDSPPPDYSSVTKSDTQPPPYSLAVADDFRKE